MAINLGRIKGWTRRGVLGAATRVGSGLWVWTVAACTKSPKAPVEAVTPTPKAPPAQKSAVTPAPPRRALAKPHAKTLEAALVRLIPPGSPAGTPGAVEVGVMQYVERQLAEPQFAPFYGLVKKGAIMLERVAMTESKTRFAALEPAAQDDLLRRFQAGKIATKFPTAKFFEVLHTLAFEGFMGAPKYGGNRDKIAWRSIGFDPRCRDHEMGPP